MYTDNLDLKRQGFIIEARDKAEASLAAIPERRTLVLAQLTDRPAAKPEMVYELEKMDDVFNHYKPEKKIEYQNEEGASINETIEFRNLSHFTKKSFIQRSNFLAGLSQKQKDHQTFAKRLQSNRTLQAVLNDPEKKAAYITILKSLIQELDA